MKHNKSFKHRLFPILFLPTLISMLLLGCTNTEQLLTNGGNKIWGDNQFQTAYRYFNKRLHTTNLLLNYYDDTRKGMSCNPIPSYMVKGKRIITYFNYKDNYKYMLDTLDILHIRKNRLIYVSKNDIGLAMYTTDFDVEYNDTTIRQMVYEDVAGRLREKYKMKTTRIYFPESGIKEYPDENAQVACYLDKLMQHGNNEYLFCWCYITEKGEKAKGRGKERKSCVRFEYTLDKKGVLAFRKEKSYRI